MRTLTILCVVCNLICYLLRSVGWYFWCGCARCEDATECGSQVIGPPGHGHDIDSFTVDPLCVCRWAASSALVSRRGWRRTGTTGAASASRAGAGSSAGAW